MLRNRIFAFLIIFTVVLSTSVNAFAQSPPQQVKADVERRIRDNKDKVKIDLTDHTKVSGKLTSSGADSYTLTENKTGLSRTLQYSDTARVKGYGWSTGKKVGIIAAIGGGIATVVILAVFHHITQNN
jgi:hypothetical protein